MNLLRDIWKATMVLIVVLFVWIPTIMVVIGTIMGVLQW